MANLIGNSLGGKTADRVLKVNFLIQIILIKIIVNLAVWVIILKIKEISQEANYKI